MSKLTLPLILFAVLFTGIAGGEDYGDIERYIYNPLQDNWKLRANKAVIKYNHVENTWDHVYPGEVLRFNSEEGDWDFQFPELGLRYDILDEKWIYRYAPPPGVAGQPGPTVGIPSSLLE